MNAEQAIILARKHVGNGAAMESSARLCLADAVALRDKGRLVDAKARAIRSLSYSVGIFHSDYRRAIASSRIRRAIAGSRICQCDPCSVGDACDAHEG